MTEERRLQRAAMRRMLLIETAARRRLSAAITSATRSAGTLSRSVILFRIEEAAGTVIRTTRTAARGAGHRALLLELAHAAKRARQSHPVLRSTERTLEDTVRAQAIASGLSRRWVKFVAEGDSIREATEAVRSRVNIIAATETSQAFNDERDFELREFERTTSWAPFLMKEWDATLDRKVCPICDELDGTRKPLGFSFPEGALPGAVHPRCRCVVVTTLLPLPLGRDEQPVANLEA